MSSLNKAQIIGNLGRDPELRATLSVATSESWKDRDTGERKERTEWHRVVILNNDGLYNRAFPVKRVAGCESRAW